VRLEHIFYVVQRGETIIAWGTGLFPNLLRSLSVCSEAWVGSPDEALVGTHQ